MLTLIGLVVLAADPAPARVPSAWAAARSMLVEEMNRRWAERSRAGRDRASADRGPDWLPRLCPPIPQVWPPDGKGGYVVHAFAAGMTPALRDGEEVAAPWADWRIAGATRTVEDRGPLRRLGTQGVRPLQAAEVEVARTSLAAEQAVVALTRARKPPGAPAPLVKRWYCQWTFTNGVIAAELQRLHPQFYAWLACGS